MTRSIVLILGAFTAILTVGCDGLNRIHGDRNDGYDTTPVGFTSPRPGIYAVFQGFASNGERLYLVHGGLYDKRGLSDSTVKALGIPEYPN